MRPVILAACAVVLALVGCASPAARSPGDFIARFDQARAGQPPSGWRVAATNPTAPLARWEVISDPSAPTPPHALALTRTENYDGTFNLAIAEGTRFRDLELRVRVKAVEGQEDQGGGPIWRCQDENNYYVCRYNPLESNFRVYVVAGGKRRQLATVKAELAAGRWYEVFVRMTGDRVICELDGGMRLEVTDGTIARDGMVGLWTKADAVTSFDDFVVRAVSEGK